MMAARRLEGALAGNEELGAMRGSAYVGIAMTITLAMGSQGCTLIGLGVGSAIPRFEKVDPERLRTTPVGKEIRVYRERARDPDAHYSPSGPSLDGTFEGIKGEEITVADASTAQTGGDASSPARARHLVNVREVQAIELRNGTYALPLMVAGGVLDILVIAGFVILVATSPPPNYGGGIKF